MCSSDLSCAKFAAACSRTATAATAAEPAAARAEAAGRIGEVQLQMLQVEEEGQNKALSELRDVEAQLAELRERRLTACLTPEQRDTLIDLLNRLHANLPAVTTSENPRRKHRE